MEPRVLKIDILVIREFAWTRTGKRPILAVKRCPIVTG
jgi:hypothetical protein